ncbi:MAG: single-stranded-DNA-specific exonuclease, partial [Sulfurimonas sp.]
PNDFIPNEKISGILSTDDIDLNLIDLLESFEPFGEANPRPSFLLQNAQVVSIKLMGQDKSHSRIEIRQFAYDRKTIELIAFRTVFEMPQDKKITCSYKVAKNEFNKRVSTQLLINKIF